MGANVHQMENLLQVQLLMGKQPVSPCSVVKHFLCYIKLLHKKGYLPFCPLVY